MLRDHLLLARMSSASVGYDAPKLGKGNARILS